MVCGALLSVGSTDLAETPGCNQGPRPNQFAHLTSAKWSLALPDEPAVGAFALAVDARREGVVSVVRRDHSVLVDVVPGYGDPLTALPGVSRTEGLMLIYRCWHANHLLSAFGGTCERR